MNQLPLSANNINLKFLKPYTSFILIIFLMVSCTTQVDIEIKAEKQYVLNCLFSPNKYINMYVFKTTGILDNSTEVGNGLPVQLYKEDKLVWEGVTDSNGESYIPVMPERGGKYSVILRDRYNLNLSASDTVPEFVAISDAVYSYPVYTDRYNTMFGKISISFQDSPETKNYYEIVLLNARDSTLNGTFNINHPVITLDNENDPNPPGSLLFTDELFDGKELTLDIFVASEKPLVVLNNVSKNYYDYRQSLVSHLFSQNTRRETVYELFKGDPVELYSNVKNGLGIFAGYTQDTKECKMLNP